MTESFQPLATRLGDAPALIDDRGVTSWAQLDERANRLVDALRARGVVAHDTIAVMVGNRREFFEIFAAVCHANLVAVPVNWHWVAAELAYVLNDSGARALLVDDAFLDVAVAARATASGTAGGTAAGGACEHWIVVGDTPPPAGFESFEAVLADASPAEPADQGTGGPMFYTSGTTGFPKGVRSSLSTTGEPPVMWSLIAGSFTQMLQLPADGVTLLDGPAYHSAQWVFSMFPLFGGSTLVIRPRFDAAETLAAIDRHAVTNVHLVPTQFVRLLKLDDDVRERFDGSSLRTVFHGAAPCPVEVKRQMLDWWGDVVSEYYGGTEAGFLTTISGAEWRERPGSLGRTTDLAELRIVGDDGGDVPPGTPGTIYFRSRIGSDFHYHGDPDKTAAAHLDGWATLGDIGSIDEDGYLTLSDRRIDMIISGGVNIYPAEIEGALVAHPLVNDAAVFGIPDDQMGEQVKAVVELVDGAEPPPELEAELVAFCRERLAGYKAPRSVDVVDALPRQPTGKLFKRLLRDPYWADAGRSI
ncbi:MAG: AMP-binding protein [Acidimicrobiales bacterium]